MLLLIPSNIEPLQVIRFSIQQLKDEAAADDMSANAFYLGVSCLLFTQLPFNAGLTKQSVSSRVRLRLGAAFRPGEKHWMMQSSCAQKWATQSRQ
jgi:hypothetical protein